MEYLKGPDLRGAFKHIESKSTEAFLYIPFQEHQSWKFLALSLTLMSLYAQLHTQTA
jgi:hypothetical protein